VSERPSLREAARDVLEACRARRAATSRAADLETTDRLNKALNALQAALSSPSPEPGERGDLRWERGRFEGQRCWFLRSSARGTEHATVWLSGTWHTWDANGVGGENDEESDPWIAMQEAEAALVRQGWLDAAELRAHRAREEGR